MSEDFKFDSQKKLYVSNHEYFCVGCMDSNGKKMHLIVDHQDPNILVCPACKQSYKNPDHKPKSKSSFKKSLFDL